MEEDEYVTPDHIARCLEVNRKTGTNMARAGRLPGTLRFGGRWRFHLPALRAWFDRATRKEIEEPPAGEHLESPIAVRLSRLTAERRARG